MPLRLHDKCILDRPTYPERHTVIKVLKKSYPKFEIVNNTLIDGPKI